jgi:hypothetical protein
MLIAVPTKKNAPRQTSQLRFQSFFITPFSSELFSCRCSWITFAVTSTLSAISTNQISLGLKLQFEIMICITTHTLLCSFIRLQIYSVSVLVGFIIDNPEDIDCLWFH